MAPAEAPAAAPAAALAASYKRLRPENTEGEPVPKFPRLQFKRPHPENTEDEPFKKILRLTPSDTSALRTAAHANSLTAIAKASMTETINAGRSVYLSSLCVPGSPITLNMSMAVPICKLSDKPIKIALCYYLIPRACVAAAAFYTTPIFWTVSLPIDSEMVRVTAALDTRVSGVIGPAIENYRHIEQLTYSTTTADGIRSVTMSLVYADGSPVLCLAGAAAADTGISVGLHFV
ncbi:hypothetical protein T492DRAFT_851236 [Pavlovales sp. CCMP2436]|nr:hypothetical protein T492DRAFT_851236 [Pavlovales sp. CCMP2436]